MSETQTSDDDQRKAEVRRTQIIGWLIFSAGALMLISFVVFLFAVGFPEERTRGNELLLMGSETILVVVGSLNMIAGWVIAKSARM